MRRTRAALVDCLGLCVLMVFPLSAHRVERKASLVLYLPLDEGKGVLVQDRSRFRNNGTINGKPTWLPGKRGNALRFHGAKTNAFVDVRPSASLNGMGAHTLSFWLQWDGQGASWSPLLTKRPVDVTDPDQCSTWVRSDGRFDYRNDHGTVFANRNVRLTNEWTFLAVTHDGKDTVTFFIDGVPAGKKKLTKAASNDGPFVIGSGRHLAGDFGAGTIDEVAIFDSDLTAAEIKELREQGPMVSKRAK